MKIEIPRRNAINLKLFLEGLGFCCVFNLTPNADVVEMVVKEDNEFISSILSYVQEKGFIPYHYTISPLNKGAVQTEIKFEGKATQVNEFVNVSGRFRLVLFEGENNFLWKTYSDTEIPTTLIAVSGRYVTSFPSLDGKILNLINYVRLKEIK